MTMTVEQQIGQAAEDLKAFCVSQRNLAKKPDA